jgi:hypothetical protein
MTDRSLQTILRDWRAAERELRDGNDPELIERIFALRKEYEEAVEARTRHDDPDHAFSKMEMA